MRVLLFILFAALLTSCSEGTKKPNAVFRLDRAILAGPFNGMLYGRHAGTGKKFAKKFTDASPSITLSLLNGSWEFALIAWDGANAYEGTVKCATQQSVLNGEARTIAADLTVDGCANTIFGGTNSAEPTLGLKTVNFNNCSNIDHVTAFDDTCSSLQRGFNRSFKFALAEYNDFTSDSRSVAYDSVCIPTTPADGVTTTSLRLPIGDTNSMFDLIVKSYDDFACTGYEDVSVVKKGLSDPETKVYGDQAAISYVFFEDQGRDQITFLATAAISPSGGSAKPFFTLPTTPEPTYVYQIDGTNGPTITNRIFSSDLTRDGTSPLFPSPTVVDYATLDMIKVGNNAFFAADPNFSERNELFLFDGYNTPTQITNIGVGGTAPTGVKDKIYSSSGVVYFVIKDNANIEQLCKYDGSLSCAIHEAGLTSLFIVGSHGGKLYYTGITGGNVLLYSYDGASNNLEINLTGTEGITAISNVMYSETLSTFKYIFIQATPSNKNFILKIPDAAAASVLVVDIPFIYANNPPIKTASNLWVVVNEGAQGEIPASIDLAGTITPISTSFASAIGTKLIGTLGTKLMFFSDDQGSSDNKLFSYDGSVALVADHDVSIPNDLNGTKIFDSKLYFVGHQSTEGQEPYVYDGTTATLLKDINSGAPSSSPSKFIVLKNTIYFTADDGASGQEVWKTDGTNPGTSIVANIGSGASSSFANAFSATSNYLYFVANDATFYRFYRSDGTTSGTIPLYNVQSDSYSSKAFVWDDRIHYQLADTSQIHSFFIK